MYPPLVLAPGVSKSQGWRDRNFFFLLLAVLRPGGGGNFFPSQLAIIGHFFFFFDLILETKNGGSILTGLSTDHWVTDCNFLDNGWSVDKGLEGGGFLFNFYFNSFNQIKSYF